MALRGSLYGFVVGSFFSSSAYQFFPYFLVGYTSALVAIVEAKKTKRERLGKFRKRFEEIYGEYQEPAAASLAR
jgi:hypothetical protein